MPVLWHLAKKFFFGGFLGNLWKLKKGGGRGLDKKSIFARQNEPRWLI